MNRLMKLQQDRADAKKRMDALHAAAHGENRAMTAEEVTKYNAEKEAIKNLDANIEIEKAKLDEERTAPAVEAQVGNDRAEGKPWASLAEQLQAVKTAASTHGRTTDPRLFGALGQNETVDAEGGFLVSPQFSGDLLTRAFQSSIIASRCRHVPMSSSRLVINGVDDASRAAGSRFGGITVYRVAEAAPLTASKIKFRRVELNANKLIGLFYATDELLEDAPALESQISDYFPLAFGWQVDNEIINGTGSGQFLGVLNSGAVVVVPKDSGQSSTGGTPNPYTVNNFVNMKARLAIESRQNAAFLVGPDFEPAVTQLTLGTGTAVELLYKMPGTLANPGKYGKILGIDVIPIEQTAALGVQGDVLLADFSQYIIGERTGIKFASSIHVAFLTDEQAFRWTLRNDGQPLWDKPLTQANSANKVSPFVTLQAR